MNLRSPYISTTIHHWFLDKFYRDILELNLHVGQMASWGHLILKNVVLYLYLKNG